MGAESAPPVLTTERLALRELTEDDAGFMVELLNDGDFLRYIGDRGVRTEDEARAYLREGTIASYAERGFGMYRAERREDGAVVGICGLVRRDGLDSPDLGFALLPAYRGAGYAAEGAAAMLDYAHEALGLRRILAIATPDNEASIALLEGIGMTLEGQVCLPKSTEFLNLYVYAAPT